jgi:hypothetical protein
MLRTVWYYSLKFSIFNLWEGRKFQNILWHIDPLLGNGSVNTPATYVHSTIEGHPSLGNGEVNMPGILGKGVFDVVHAEISMWSMPRFISITVWSNEESQWVIAKPSWAGKRWLCQWFVNSCNQLYKDPINSIIKSKTCLLSHADPRYVTILSQEHLSEQHLIKDFSVSSASMCITRMKKEWVIFDILKRSNDIYNDSKYGYSFVVT